jgi:hypothetical protein
MGTFSDTDKTVLNSTPTSAGDTRRAGLWFAKEFVPAGDWTRETFAAWLDSPEAEGPRAELRGVLEMLGLYTPAPKRSTKFGTEHGTQAGWRWHRRRNETPCPPCFSAHERHLDDTAPANPRGPYGPRKNAAECGTRGGYDRHKRDGEPVCDECKENRRVEEREARARRKARDAAGMPRASKKPRGITPERAEYLRRFVAEAIGQGGPS